MIRVSSALRQGSGLVLMSGLALVLAGCSSAPAVRDSVSDSMHLRVVAIHDFHGALQPTTYPWSDGRAVGGVATVAAAMDSAEADCGCPTIRLDGGDQMQGTLESNLVHGASVVSAFNLMGIDAAAVGNHELDWGVDTLRARQREARYVWLAANVFRVADGTRPDWATPYTVIERGGLRVAVVGYVTVRTPLTTSIGPEGTKDYEFRGGMESIRDVLDEVRPSRPDFTVLVAHAAGNCVADSCSGEIVDLVAEIPAGSLQLVVAGHDHDAGGGVVSSVPIVRAGSSGRAVSVVDLIRRSDGTRSFHVATDTTYTDAYTPDADLMALLEPYQALVDSLERRPVATLAEAVAGRPLGDFIADASRLHEEADVGLHNPGGVRAALAAGPASYADVFRVLPFGNALVEITLSGATLREVVEQGVAGRRPYHFSNLHVVYDPREPLGSRVVSLTLADGSPVLPDSSYTLATSDFLADGGDGFTMLSGLPRRSDGTQQLDAVMQRLRAMPTPVRIADEPRIVERIPPPWG